MQSSGRTHFCSCPTAPVRFRPTSTYLRRSPASAGCNNRPAGRRERKEPFCKGISLRRKRLARSRSPCHSRCRQRLLTAASVAGQAIPRQSAPLADDARPQPQKAARAGFRRTAHCMPAHYSTRQRLKPTDGPDLSGLTREASISGAGSSVRTAQTGRQIFLRHGTISTNALRVVGGAPPSPSQTRPAVVSAARVPA